jgi:hypothetical protein
VSFLYHYKMTYGHIQMFLVQNVQIVCKCLELTSQPDIRQRLPSTCPNGVVEPCNNHGTCDTGGNCQCNGHWTGATCDSCGAGWEGDECVVPHKPL